MLITVAKEKVHPCSNLGHSRYTSFARVDLMPKGPNSVLFCGKTRSWCRLRYVLGKLELEVWNVKTFTFATLYEAIKDWLTFTDRGSKEGLVKERHMFTYTSTKAKAGHSKHCLRELERQLRQRKSNSFQAAARRAWRA